MHSRHSGSEESLLSVHEEETSVGLKRVMEARQEHQIQKTFQALYVFTACLGGGLLVLTFYWIFGYRGGLAWSSHAPQQFNFHPLMMMLGMVVFYSQAILIYRSQSERSKRCLKIVHAVLHSGAFIFTVIGLKAVFDSHNYSKPKPTPNLYTLHSWLGLFTVIMFSIQLVIGFVTFLFPGLSKTIRKSILPAHVALGTAMFTMVIVTSMMGLTEKAIWAVSNYADYPGEGLLVNFIGMFLIFYGLMVLYLVNHKDYKRKEQPDDEITLAPTE